MKKILSIISILILFVLVGCQVVVNNKEYTLPDLSNKTLEQVKDVFIDAPITLIYRDKITDTIEEGLFFEYGNNLSVNDKVAYGTMVYVYFSDNPANNEKVILPDLNGKTFPEIMTIMDNYSLNVRYETVDGEESNHNYFVGYGNDLSFGTEVLKNSEVIIKIGFSSIIVLPDLVGKNLTQINDILNELDITYIINFVENQTIADNLFISYGDSLISGTEVDRDSEITINVSRNNYVQLPDLTLKTKSEIEDLFMSLDIDIILIEEINETLEIGSFIRYENHNSLEYVLRDSEVTIVISKRATIYFDPLELEYDGPRIDPIYSNIDPVEPRGGYYLAPLVSCVDGDTAKFDYPEFIDDIVGSYESVRFLNMDTEETYYSPEEWGKPASNYTCSMLTNAESILIQTDPDDNLTDVHGRLLGWIWIVPEGTNVKPGETTYTIDQYELLNYKVMQQGLAQVKYLFGAGEIKYNNMSYTDWMYKAMNYAKDNDLGQWGELLDPYWDYQNNQPKGW